jgi:hypothetical protein
MNAKQEHPMFVTAAEVKELQSKDFFEFNSPEYGRKVPSISYLISQVILLMEKVEQYIMKRMQMIDGKHLSGNHSFKIAKQVMSNGTKSFTALYCLMNEFGQVLGWWFTTGTGMRELEAPLSKIPKRHHLLGYDAVASFTTDDCCHQRKFLNDVFSFAGERIDWTDVDDHGIHEMRVVQLPIEPKVADCPDMTNIWVDEIYKYFDSQPSELRIMGVDCEWEIGRKKADTCQIGLMNNKTYLFHLAKMCRGKTNCFLRLRKVYWRIQL